jgi:MYXO-CTERM domain-containing protein
MACNTCQRACVPAGRVTAHLGDSCTTGSDCPSGAACLLSQTFAGGYCTQGCVLGTAAGDACGCPASTACESLGFRGSNCLLVCPQPGVACSRAGYFCQPLTDGSDACLPPCHIRMFQGQSFDTCSSLGSSKACDVASGICGGPIVYDAGTDAGPIADTDAGADAGADGGLADGGSAGTVTVAKSGCGCTPGSGGPDALSFLAAFTALARARKRRIAASMASI